MQPTQKAGDPSMEDILASIRKIISDDPSAIAAAVAADVAPALNGTIAGVRRSNGPAGGAASGAASDAASAPPVPGSTPLPLAPAAAQTDGNSLAALDRDLAELLREPINLPPVTTTAPVTTVANVGPPARADEPAPVRFSPGMVVPTPAEPSAASAGAHANGFSAWLRGRPNGTVGSAAASEPATRIEPPNEAPLVAPADRAAAAEHVTSAFAPVSTAPTAEAVARPVTPLTPLTPVGPAEASPSQLMRANGADGAAVSQPAPVPPLNGAGHSGSSVQSILDRLGTAPTAMPVPAPVMSRSFSAVPKPEAAPAAAPANRVIDANSPAPAIEPSTAIPATVAAPVPAAPVPPGSPLSVERVVDAALAMPLVEPQPEPKAVSGATAMAPVVVPPQTEIHASSEPRSAAAISSAKPESTLDDTLAELLRPMVRQWLDQNMMRALEKAVRVEMTESVMSAMAALTPDPKD